MGASESTATKVRFNVLFVIIYATMFLFGLVENIKGVSFPLIKSEFQVPYDSQGGLVSVTWFGYVIFSLAASLFMQRFGIKRAILAGYILVTVGALATLTAPTFLAVTFTLLIVNAGFGFFEVGANALGTVVFTASAALMMNLMHFFYGAGAILGPQAAGFFTGNLGMNWRQVYIAIIVPTAALFLFILVTNFKTHTAQYQSEDDKPRITFFAALKNPLVILICAMIGFMVVVEVAAANWGGLYLKDVYGLDPSVAGAAFVSLFFILFTLSRLVSGLVIEKIGYMRSLFIAIIGDILVLLVGFSLGRNGIWVLPLSGFFVAVLFPTTLAVVMKVFGNDAQSIIGVLITVGGAINGTFQWVIGLINQYVGPAWGYRSCLLYASIALGLLIVLSRRIKKVNELSVNE
jgi:fucose permease